jgi:hypothetical protein
MIQNGSPYNLLSTLVLSEWKKWRYKLLGPILGAGLIWRFGALKLPKPLWGVKRSFWDQNFAIKVPNSSMLFYTSRAFQGHKDHLNQISYEEVMALTS